MYIPGQGSPLRGRRSSRKDSSPAFGPGLCRPFPTSGLRCFIPSSMLEPTSAKDGKAPSGLSSGYVFRLANAAEAVLTDPRAAHGGG